MASNIACSDPLCTKQRAERALVFVEQLAGLLVGHKSTQSAKLI